MGLASTQSPIQFANPVSIVRVRYHGPVASAGDHLDAAWKALRTRDDRARAAQHLARIRLASVRDPGLLCDIAQFWYELEHAEHAETAFQRALVLDPSTADAAFGLGLIAEARGDRDEMIWHWLRTLELDRDGPPPPHHISEDEFSAIADAAYAELPPRALELLENVAVLIDDQPSADLVRRGFEPRLLGLIFGGDLSRDERVLWSQSAPDVIQLFQLNIERCARSQRDLAEQVRITVLHETAHFFGLDDDDLHAIGLG